MANKPRIAFCFSGQARTLDQTYLFFQKNLFEAAKEQGFDYDVFCAVEDDEDVDKVNLLNPTKVEKIRSSEVEKIIEEKYGDFIKIAFKTKYKRASYTYEWVVRFLQQIYKVSKSIRLCSDFGKYDILVRLRFDTIFFNQFNFNQILKTLKKGKKIICNSQEKKQLFLKVCNSTREIQDFFFFGDSESMKILGDIFDNFEECFLGHEIKKIFKPIYILSNRIADFFSFVRNRTGLYIPLLWKEFGAYIIFTPEKAYYEYFLYHNIKIIKDKISIILVRKSMVKSYVRLEDKTKYEI